MQSMSLNGIWKLSGKPQEQNVQKIELEAMVPGCVQLDLAKAGFLPEDLFMGENIKEAEKYEDYEWWYEYTFTAPQKRENVWLVFEGVDCIADYYINGEKIGESENMFVRHEFEIGEFLKDGKNLLTVHIKSAVIAAHYRNYTANTFFNWHDSAVEAGVRKAPHSFGWDIMPRAVTAGIWRDVKIEVRDKITFSQLFFSTTATKCTALYELGCRWSDFKDVEVEFTGSCKNSRFYARKKVSGKKIGNIELEIENPQAWWPYGYGEANVYDVVARIYSDGKLVHEENATFGLRTVELEHSDITDGKSGRFRFLINGVEIMCKGANWVPLDAFHSRDAERYDKALALVKDIGCNILRCWGGNVYENHSFFDFCDRNGIMVWQDFAMACRICPQDDEYMKLMEQEATAVVRAFRNHPSIILWSGDNEVDPLLSLYGKPSVNRITREVLPRVIALNDYARPYLASSPYISDVAYEAGARSQIHGSTLPEDHLWGPRDYFKSDFYKNNKAHFVSETGYHGCPSLESIKKFITKDKVWPYQNNNEWIFHSSDQMGNDARVMLMHNQVMQLFGEVPSEIEEYILASQISQAEAKKYFIERMRAGRPHKTGIIWWNLLDGWPQMSDAVVDYYFTKKLAYEYIKRSQAPFTIVAGEPEDWNLKFFACNDTLCVRSGHFKVIDAFTDEILVEDNFIVNENSTTQIAELPVFYSEHRFFIIKWEIEGESGFNHYMLGYPPFSLENYKIFMKKISEMES